MYPVPAARRLLSAGLAVAFALGATAADAALIDFTKLGISGNLGTSFTLPNVLPGISLTVSSSKGVITSSAFDGGVSSGCLANGGPLACVNDGLGIDDDEVTAGEAGVLGERLKLTFSEVVTFTGFSLLDHYAKPNSNHSEKARIVVDGTLLGVFAANAHFQTDGGYAAYLLGPVTGRVLAFTMAGGNANNDGEGQPDAALASVSISPVPLPAAGALLLAGIAGLFGLRRRPAG